MVVLLIVCSMLIKPCDMQFLKQKQLAHAVLLMQQSIVCKRCQHSQLIRSVYENCLAYCFTQETMCATMRLILWMWIKATF